MRVVAAAKINLSLEVLGKRPDGFHELRSFMQEVTLCDELTIEQGSRFQLQVDEPALCSDDNLVTRAARLATECWQLQGSFRIRLDKHIPIAAGLGGGSSDAAATLITLGRLQGAPQACDQYLELAALLGSDVPFFLYGGRALVQGRGELVSPLPDGPERWFVLVNPHIAVSTARVFAHLGSEERASGDRTWAMARAAQSGEDPEVGVNTLQPVLFRLYPEAERCFRVVDDLAPGRTIVSGSGPTVVAAMESEADARATARRLATLGYWTAAVRNRNREGDRPCP
jgi:4-diphosphocytidyl-2-C-methyl-D-erythritol kinase